MKSFDSLDINPKDYDYKVVLFGSGPSVNEFRKIVSTSHQISPDSRTPFAVHLNSTVFSDIPYDLCLFEVSSNRDIRGFHNGLFEAGAHLSGANDSSRLVFTHVSLDNVDDFIRLGIHRRLFLLPQMYLWPPHSLGKKELEAVRLGFRIHAFLSKLSLVPPGLWCRASAVRAVLLLVFLGFKDFQLIGFDGGTNAFYMDSEIWPELGELRSAYRYLHDESGELKVMRNGGLTAKYMPSGVYAKHNTENSDLGAFTVPILLRIISEVFNVNIHRFKTKE